MSQFKLSMNDITETEPEEELPKVIKIKRKRLVFEDNAGQVEDVIGTSGSGSKIPELGIQVKQPVQTRLPDDEDGYDEIGDGARYQGRGEALSNRDDLVQGGTVGNRVVIINPGGMGSGYRQQHYISHRGQTYPRRPFKRYSNWYSGGYPQTFGNSTQPWRGRQYNYTRQYPSQTEPYYRAQSAQEPTRTRYSHRTQKGSRRY